MLSTFKIKTNKQKNKKERILHKHIHLHLHIRSISWVSCLSLISILNTRTYETSYSKALMFLSSFIFGFVSVQHARFFCLVVFLKWYEGVFILPLDNSYQHLLQTAELTDVGVMAQNRLHSTTAQILLNQILLIDFNSV